MSNPIRRNTPASLDVQSLRRSIDGIDDYQMKIHQAAKWYASNGFMIVPFRPGDKDGKFSGYPKGISQHHATKNIKKIDEWWHPTTGKFPGASIAMAHGGQAGTCAVDLDRKADIDGIQNLADLQLAYGDYDDGEGEGLQTLMASTPSGGRHLVFKYHPEIISNSEVSFPGIDTRGGLKKDATQNGGITFVEPSKKPKTDGNYRWDDSVIDIIDMPQWMVDVLNGRTPKSSKSVQLQDSYIQSAQGEHGDGRDRNIYMDLLRFVGIGYTEDQLWALMPDILERMDPPDEEMVTRKIQSVIESDAFSKSKIEKKSKEQLTTLELDRDDKDRIIKSSGNLQAILTWPVFEHEYGLIEYDDFTKKYIRNKEPMNSRANWAVSIQVWINKKLMLDFPKTDIREMVEHIAFNVKPHANIAREYMMDCPSPPPIERDNNFWGSGRLGPGPAFEELCTAVLDLGNTKLHPDYTDDMALAYRGFLWFWLQGTVSRVCVPGCKMEIVLNIFGSQGIGKSLFFRDLCPDASWFTDSIQDSIVGAGQNNRDELLKLNAKMIVEMPELNPIKRGGKSADDKMKQFISAQVDNYRPAYGHDPVDFPRTCALGGTSNNNDVYRDSTGDRRFVSIDHGNVPIKVGDLNKGTMKRLRDSLWGEVTTSFMPGELDLGMNDLLVSIPFDLREKQSEINNAHRYEEIGLQEILDWVQDKTRITWSEIIEMSRSVPGLRDIKENQLIQMVRKSLKNDKNFMFKRRITISTMDGKTEKTNAWVNYNLDIEKQHRAGLPVPPHWSSYIAKEADRY